MNGAAFRMIYESLKVLDYRVKIKKLRFFSIRESFWLRSFFWLICDIDLDSN